MNEFVCVVIYFCGYYLGRVMPSKLNDLKTKTISIEIYPTTRGTTVVCTAGATLGFGNGVPGVTASRFIGRQCLRDIDGRVDGRSARLVGPGLERVVDERILQRWVATTEHRRRTAWCGCRDKHTAGRFVGRWGRDVDWERVHGAVDAVRIRVGADHCVNKEYREKELFRGLLPHPRMWMDSRQNFRFRGWRLPSTRIRYRLVGTTLRGGNS